MPATLRSDQRSESVGMEFYLLMCVCDRALPAQVCGTEHFLFVWDRALPAWVCGIEHFLLRCVRERQSPSLPVCLSSEQICTVVSGEINIF